jgi:hypothetical protein
MALFGFDMDPFEYLDEAVESLEDELQDDGESVVSVRPGYDGHPRNYDLWQVEDLAFEGQGERPWKADELSGYLERFMDADSYLDWRPGSGFDDGSVETVGLYKRGDDELLIEVYEAGSDGHDLCLH